MATLTKCPDCAHEVSKKAETCPKCGKRLRGSFSTRIFKGYMWFLVIVSVIFFGGCMMLLSGG